ncbi:MAG: efflux RND transporter periplasmic adaptor subunit [Rhodothermales bacterium]
MNRYLLSVLCAVLLTAGCGDNGDGSAEEAHEHGTGTAVTVWTDSMEVFFEYPPMLAGLPAGPWAVHVTRTTDYRPVEAGRLTLAFRAADGQVYTTSADAPARPGIFMPSPELPDPGTYELAIDVQGPRLQDRVRAGSIEVFADSSAIPLSEEPDGAPISFLKEQQWTMTFGVARAEERDIARSLAVSGEIVPTAGRVAQVSAPVSGLALVGANESAPAPGEHVSAGQSLVVLSPSTDEQSFAAAKARVERLRRDVQRLQRLFDAEAIPEVRLIEAHHDLEVATAGLDAMESGTADGYTYTVRAPIGGVIQQRRFTPGQRVEAGESLFEIVDAREVWLLLRLPARNISSAAEAEVARFTPEGDDASYETSRRVATGSAIDPDTRTLPLTFAVNNASRHLKIGQFVRAHLQLEGRVHGVAVPRRAIMTEDGRPVVYVQLGGESFERRPVAVGPSDGTHTIVTDGVEAGEYVVTEGAYQVYLASLSTTEIGDHGHPH